MKVVAFNGSPRKEGNTAILIQNVFRKLEPESIDCELINVFGKISSGGSACYKCRDNKNRRCAIEKEMS